MGLAFWKKRADPAPEESDGLALSGAESGADGPGSAGGAEPDIDDLPEIVLPKKQAPRRMLTVPVAGGAGPMRKEKEAGASPELAAAIDATMMSFLEKLRTTGGVEALPDPEPAAPATPAPPAAGTRAPAPPQPAAPAPAVAAEPEPDAPAAVLPETPPERPAETVASAAPDADPAGPTAWIAGETDDAAEPGPAAAEAPAAWQAPELAGAFALSEPAPEPASVPERVPEPDPAAVADRAPEPDDLPVPAGPEAEPQAQSGQAEDAAATLSGAWSDLADLPDLPDAAPQVAADLPEAGGSAAGAAPAAIEAVEPEREAALPPAPQPVPLASPGTASFFADELPAAEAAEATGPAMPDRGAAPARWSLRRLLGWVSAPRALAAATPEAGPDGAAGLADAAAAYDEPAGIEDAAAGDLPPAVSPAAARFPELWPADAGPDDAARPRKGRKAGRALAAPKRKGRKAKDAAAAGVVPAAAVPADAHLTDTAAGAVVEDTADSADTDRSPLAEALPPVAIAATGDGPDPAQADPALAEDGGAEATLFAEDLPTDEDLPDTAAEAVVPETADTDQAPLAGEGSSDVGAVVGDDPDADRAEDQSAVAMLPAEDLPADSVPADADPSATQEVRAEPALADAGDAEPSSLDVVLSPETAPVAGDLTDTDTDRAETVLADDEGTEATLPAEDLPADSVAADADLSATDEVQAEPALADAGDAEPSSLEVAQSPETGAVAGDLPGTDADHAEPVHAEDGETGATLPSEDLPADSVSADADRSVTDKVQADPVLAEAQGTVPTPFDEDFSEDAVSADADLAETDTAKAEPVASDAEVTEPTPFAEDLPSDSVSAHADLPDAAADSQEPVAADAADGDDAPFAAGLPSDAGRSEETLADPDHAGTDPVLADAEGTEPGRAEGPDVIAADAEVDLDLIRQIAAETAPVPAAEASAPAAAAASRWSRLAFWRRAPAEAPAVETEPARAAPEPAAASLPDALPDPAAADGEPPPAAAPVAPAGPGRLAAAAAATGAALRGLTSAPAALVFVTAALAPAVLLPLAALQGALPLLLVLCYVVALTLLFEDLKAEAEAEVPGVLTRGAVPVLAGLSALATAAAALYFVAGAGGIGLLGFLLALPAFALWLGQVGAAMAHDLALSRRAWHRWLGTTFFAVMLLPHHASVLRTVHRRLVATLDDPYTADSDEGFWEYYSGAWEQGSVVGYEMERNLMRPRLGHRRAWLHPYLLPCLLSLILVFVVPAYLGLGGLFGYLLVAGLVQIQIFATLYVRHFGCERRRIGRTRVEPAGPAHRYVGAPVIDRLPLGAGERGAAMRSGSPVLPLPMPVMALIALVPPLWRERIAADRSAQSGRLARSS